MYVRRQREQPARGSRAANLQAGRPNNKTANYDTLKFIIDRQGLIWPGDKNWAVAKSGGFHRIPSGVRGKNNYAAADFSFW